MTSFAKTSQARILSNYLRMLVTVALGLWLVRLLIEVSPTVYAVVALVITSAGVASMFKEMIRGTMIPEIGSAFHSGDTKQFIGVFSSSFVLSFTAAIGAAIVFILFLIFLDKLSVPEEIFSATSIFLTTRMLVTSLAVFLAPATNMLPISNRMITHNLWLILERIAEVAAATISIFVVGMNDPAKFLTVYAYTSAIFMSLVYLTWAFHGYICERKTRFRLQAVSWTIVTQIARTVGWNGFVVASMNLYFRFDVFLINIVFGIVGTFVFGLATQVVNYSRQVTIGLVQGMDSVVTRINESKDQSSVSVQFLVQTSFLQSTLVCSILIVLLFNTETIFELWLAERLDAYKSSRELIIVICQIMMFGISARSFSEGWMKYLSGIGEVRAYGPVLLMGALCNPLLIGVLYFNFEDNVRIFAIPLAFTILMAIVHIGILPILVSRATGLSVKAILSPLTTPILISLIISAVLYVTVQNYPLQDIQKLALTILVTGCVMGPMFIRAFIRMKV